MSYHMFYTRCDHCGTRGEEYSAFPQCRECLDHVCHECHTDHDAESGKATCHRCGNDLLREEIEAKARTREAETLREMRGER